MKTLPSVALLLAVPTAILVPGLLSETHASGQEEVADLVQRLTARAERTMEADSLEGMVVVVGVGDDVFSNAWPNVWPRLSRARTPPSCSS